LGQEGHELWTFQAVKPGQSTLHFSYGRAWEKNIPVAKEIAVTVRVQ
ncbi:MAG: protease inhibitor I42 family protein, partial [Acidobacteriaceae bacterium]|nr:protease inhibitor I42 family protein [Acidobacteriaceae bacterium]